MVDDHSFLPNCGRSSCINLLLLEHANLNDMTPLEKIIDHHKYLPQYLRYRADYIDRNFPYRPAGVIKTYLQEGVLYIMEIGTIMKYEEFVLYKDLIPTGSNK